MAAALAGWLLPPRCVLCGGRGQRPVLDLCAACEADLPRIERACPRCALPMPPDPSFAECAHCRADPPPWEACRAPFRYDFPLAGLVHELKYDGRLAIARVLGTLLGRAVARDPDSRGAELLLPVPLHPDRLVERGFNQSVEIARWAAREVNVRCRATALRRIRPTPAQVGLPFAARVENLRGAFALTDIPEACRVVIVDDVMTTGSTVREIAWALRRAGVPRVDVWCVARTIG